jgi:hypothetical protein
VLDELGFAADREQMESKIGENHPGQTRLEASPFDAV